MLIKIIQASDNHHIKHSVISLSNSGAIRDRFEAICDTFCLDMQPSKFSLFALVNAARLIRRIKPDVIQGWMYHGNLAALWMKLFTSKKANLYWSIRQTLYDIRREKRLSRYMIHLNRLLSKFPDDIIFNSHCARKQHIEFGFEGSRTSVIPNGFDLARFRPSPSTRTQFRKSLEISENTVVIGMLARFHPMKNHTGFLEAASIFALKHPETQFLMAGTGVTEDAMINLLKNKELASRFHFIGECRNTPDFLNSIDILTVPSLWGEAFPNVIGEAMACETLVVATDLGDAKLVLNGAGIIVKTEGDSVRNIIEAWSKLLNTNKQQIRTMKSAARQHISENYEIHKIANLYNTEYLKYRQKA